MKAVNTLLILIIILIICYYFCPLDNKNITREIKHDTTYIIKHDTLTIEKQGAIRYINDTLIITKPFESKVDTNWKDKILKINYSYPENNFNVTLTEKDTMQFRTKTIKTKNSFSWLDLILGILIGFIIGIL